MRLFVNSNKIHFFVGEKIQPAMKQLCSSMLNELVSRGLYSSLEVINLCIPWIWSRVDIYICS